MRHLGARTSKRKKKKQNLGAPAVHTHTRCIVFRNPHRGLRASARRLGRSPARAGASNPASRSTTYGTQIRLGWTTTAKRSISGDSARLMRCIDPTTSPLFSTTSALLVGRLHHELHLRVGISPQFRRQLGARTNKRTMHREISVPCIFTASSSGMPRDLVSTQAVTQSPRLTAGPSRAAASMSISTSVSSPALGIMARRNGANSPDRDRLHQRGLGGAEAVGAGLRE
ncbi:hypothetical protein FB451DRAFT_1360111, partial [Mycena latifolia]